MWPQGLQGQQTLTRTYMCTQMYACMHRNNTCMSHAQGLGFGARGAAVHTQIHTHACMQHVHGPHIHTKLSGCGIPQSRAAICTAGHQTGVSPRQVSVPGPGGHVPHSHSSGHAPSFLKFHSSTCGWSLCLCMHHSAARGPPAPPDAERCWAWCLHKLFGLGLMVEGLRCKV